MSTNEPENPDRQLSLIEDALYQGRKIEAIKLYRELSDGSLADAKNAVEKLDADLRAAAPERFKAPASGSGCLGVLVTLTLIGVGILMGFVRWT